VIGNLLDNALRYARKGPISITAEREDAGTVRVSVRDHGPGIPDGALERVFERFYRGDASRTRAAPGHRGDEGDGGDEGDRGADRDGGADGEARAGAGSGLGLAIAKAIVEDHGGSIEAANHPQGGAAFTLRLPTR
jgi:signal transduction histidine kinase